MEYFELREREERELKEVEIYGKRRRKEGEEEKWKCRVEAGEGTYEVREKLGADGMMDGWMGRDGKEMS